VSEPIDETPNGEFMGTVYSGLGQLDNDNKSQRTKDGMKKAASLGRFPFRAPLGYRNVSGPSSTPKNIELDPNSCGLVQRAFELAATGLHSTAETLRKITTLGLRTAKGKPVPAQTFQRMLVNPIYAGWVVIPEWEIKERGTFLPLIDEQCFDRVQDILAGKKPNLTSYERNHPDFPLRRFVRCGKCGAPLTGSWSRGRKDRYAYYRCHKRSCLAVNVKQETLQAKFLNWLESMTPHQKEMTEMKDVIRTVWKQRVGDASDLRTVLTRKLVKVEARKATLVDRWLDSQVDQGTYAEHTTRLMAEIDEVRLELRAAEFENIELESVLTFAEKIMMRPARLWVESTLAQRQRLQKTLFPNGIVFDGEQFGTESTSLFFSLLTGFS